MLPPLRPDRRRPHMRPNRPRSPLGQRAFEIVLARKMASGETQTTWFERHGSTPITDIPAEWPEDYRKLVERRIALIEDDPNIRLIEQPEYKRRWNTESWESQLERALREWLLDRLESYFDFDGRMNDEGKPTARLPIALISVGKLADVARQDRGFPPGRRALPRRSRVRRDTPRDRAGRGRERAAAADPPLQTVGPPKREEWEKTWELQRRKTRSTPAPSSPRTTPIT